MKDTKQKESRRNQEMSIIDNRMLWRQFGAAIEMLHSALADCPDELWEARYPLRIFKSR